MAVEAKASADLQELPSATLLTSARSNPGFFVIDSQPLKHPAGKPYHLEARFRARRRRSMFTASTLDLHLSSHDVANKAFIEARRQKLQRRHSHIKGVLAKHRHDLNQDDPVGREKIQEALEAAELNRKTILERQVKSCAIQVARAREIAAAQQKKEQEELLARRQALEDRLSASEARRRAFRSTPRSRKLSANELVDDGTVVHELPSLLNSAASLIQRWYRGKAAHAVVKEWDNLTTAGHTKPALSVKNAQAMSFEEFAGCIQSQVVIKGAGKVLALLEQLKSLAPRKEDAEQERGRSTKKQGAKKEEPAAWKNANRIFLSAFIIVAHTSEIMPVLGAEEEIVQRAAADFLVKFERWANYIRAFNGPDRMALTLTLLNSWITYYDSFQAWKERDTKNIIETIVSHWMELERLWISVKDQVDAVAQWKPRIEQQQKVLLNRLKRFGDGALQRLKDERTALLLATTGNEMMDDDEVYIHERSDSNSSSSSSIPINRAAANRTPSPSPPDFDVLSTSPQTFPTKFMRKRPDSVTARSPSDRRRRSSARSSPSPTPDSPRRDNMSLSRPSTPSIVADDGNADAAEAGGRIPDLSSVAASFGASFSNEQLAHELTLDPDFALKKPVLSPLEVRVRAIAKQAFFDNVRETFANGDLMTHVPAFVSDIKKQLLSMVSEKGKISAEINEILDMDMLRQQITHKILNLQALLGYIVHKMGQLCAPLRDGAVRAISAKLSAPQLLNPEILTSVFESILDLLDDMRLDLANYKLQSLRPHLRPQAAEYERKKFANALQRGEATLDRTKAWLAGASRDAESVARARNPEGVEIPENRVRFTDIFHDAILALVFSPPDAAGRRADAMPETLTLDAERLVRFQEEGQRLTVVAALLMLTQNAVPEIRGERGALMALKDTLMILLTSSGAADQGGESDITVDNLSLQIISSVSSFLTSRRQTLANATGKAELTPAEPVELSAERAALIRTMTSKTLSTKDPVFGLLRRRIQAVVKAHVVSGVFKREGLERSGLDIVKTELEAFSVRVATWVRFNGEVYSEWYDGILREVVA
ncbi:hypothetical protein HK101_005994 [Irineochytrium annulatum]|nr:hypothetical protein HK101_005994 [Irineochytrium annulatum]